MKNDTALFMHTHADEVLCTYHILVFRFFSSSFLLSFLRSAMGAKLEEKRMSEGGKVNLYAQSSLRCVLCSVS